MYPEKREAHNKIKCDDETFKEHIKSAWFTCLAILKIDLKEFCDDIIVSGDTESFSFCALLEK